MAKRKYTRNDNRLLTYSYPNYYSWGGDFGKALNLKGALDLKGTFSGGNVANMLKGGAAGAIGGAIGNIGGSLLSGGNKSAAGSAISGIGSTVGGAVGMVNPILGAGITAASGLIGGAVNGLFGSNLNEEKISEIEGSNKAISNVMVDNSSNDSVMNQWASQDFGADFSKSDIGSEGLFSNKATNKYKELKKQQDIARNRALTAFGNAAQAADTQADLNTMANFSAYGGPLGYGYIPWGSNAIGYELAKEDLDIKAMNASNKNRITSMPNSFESPELNSFALGGGIHIKPENRGKFTASAKRAGMGVQEFASHVLANKEDYSPTQVRRANFARNASKWHAFGGDLGTQGADFGLGYTYIGNGGTHEENPNEGVQMGVDAEGTPNLVEEGEMVYDDYVFSNRLTADKRLLTELKLPKTYAGKTFAEIAKKLTKESEERPNDPISRRGLNASMQKLLQAQEIVRAQKEAGQEGRRYANGGNLFWPGGPMDDEVSTQYYWGSDGQGGYTSYWDAANKAGYTGGLWEGARQALGYTKDNEPKAPIPYNEQQVQVPYRPNDITASTNLSRPQYTKITPPTQAPQPVTSEEEDTTGETKTAPTWMRYAPVVGSAIGLGQGLLSKPDYYASEAVLEAANKAGEYTPVEYDPIGNYLQYNPFDRNYYINKLNAQAGATRRAIINQSAGNRANAVAGLLAADYNAQGRLGDLARQAEEYNLAQRQQVETFNRATNQANAEMGLKAAMANQAAQLKARNAKLSGVAQAMGLRNAVDAQRAASISANMTNLFNSLGDIGKENMARNMVMTNPALYYSIGADGKVSYKNGYDDLSESEKSQVRAAAKKAATKKKAKGGYLTIKKGGRYA